ATSKMAKNNNTAEERDLLRILGFPEDALLEEGAELMRWLQDPGEEMEGLRQTYEGEIQALVGTRPSEAGDRPPQREDGPPEAPSFRGILEEDFAFLQECLEPWRGEPAEIHALVETRPTEAGDRPPLREDGPFEAPSFRGILEEDHAFLQECL